MRQSVGAHRKKVGISRAMRWRLLAVTFLSWSKPAHVEEWMRTDTWWCSRQWLQLCSAHVESWHLEGARSKALRADWFAFFFRREAETAADDLVRRDSSKLRSLCRMGKRHKGTGTGQLAVLKNKRGALVTTPQEKNEMRLDKFVDEFGLRAGVSDCVSDVGDIPTLEAGDNGASAHPGLPLSGVFLAQR